MSVPSVCVYVRVCVHKKKNFIADIIDSIESYRQTNICHVMVLVYSVRE